MRFSGFRSRWLEPKDAVRREMQGSQVGRKNAESAGGELRRSDGRSCQSALPIALRLQLKHRCVAAPHRQELLVRPLLQDAAVVDDDNVISHPYGWEAVRDEQDGTALGELAEAF